MGEGPRIDDRAESLTHHNGDGHAQNCSGAQRLQTKMSAEVIMAGEDVDRALVHTVIEVLLKDTKR